MLILTSLGLQPQHLRDGGLVAGLELLAVPDLAAGRRQLDHAVHRLHRRVREVGELERRLDGLCRARHRLGRVAIAAGDGPGRGGEALVLGEDVGRGRLERRRIVPLDLQRVAAVLGGPEAGGDDRHAVGHLDDVADAGQRRALRRRSSLTRAPKRGGCATTAVSMSGSFTSAVNMRAAVALGLRVLARHVLADEHEVLRVLELDLGRAPASRPAAAASSPNVAFRLPPP